MKIKTVKIGSYIVNEADTARFKKQPPKKQEPQAEEPQEPTAKARGRYKK